MNLEKIKKILAVISILFVITGFGMIHNGKPLIENIGSCLIGVGSLYLIIILILSMREK